MRWSTSGARSAPFGQTIVPSSSSTLTSAKDAGSRSGSNIGPASVIASARSILGNEAVGEAKEHAEIAQRLHASDLVCGRHGSGSIVPRRAPDQSAQGTQGRTGTPVAIDRR